VKQTRGLEEFRWLAMAQSIDAAIAGQSNPSYRAIPPRARVKTDSH